MEFKNKNILILSQQDWGEMFISKHHYAVELAKAGNTVYYINGPEQAGRIKKGEVLISETKHPNLFLIRHRLPFPYILKFRARRIYDYLLKAHIRNIINKTDRTIDLVWSFDLSDTIPLRSFPADIRKIYMPVDELEKEVALKAAKGADVIISVTHEILDKFSVLNTPKLFLNHGVAEYFINEDVSDTIHKPIQVGLSGNFLRADIDTVTLENIITSNKEVVFNFWGSIDSSKSNLISQSTLNPLVFIKELKKMPNVKLHGHVAPDVLAKELKKMDCFLICYDIDKDHSKGTNYHKVLEYLATGKTIVSNNITTYSNYTGLIEMPVERNNTSLPKLFHTVIAELDEYNSIAKQEERIAFARAYTYKNQLRKIENSLH